jgi:hypothetical protein
MSHGPGIWQQMILEALDDNPGGFVLACLSKPDRRPTRSDISARQRAASMLDASGRCKLVRVWVQNTRGVKAAMIAVRRPDTGLPGNFAVTWYEKDLITRGGDASSDRLIARRMQCSPATVKSVRLSVEAGEFERVQH